MDASRYAALFAAESREHLAEIDSALLALEQADTSDSTGHAAPLGAIFRGMHTIKGMAAAMGHEAVEQLAHALESRCEPLRAGSEALRAPVLDLLFDGTALLRDAIAEATGTPTDRTDGADAEGAGDLSARIARYLQRLASDGVLEAAAEVRTGAWSGNATAVPDAGVPDAVVPDAAAPGAAAHVASGTPASREALPAAEAHGADVANAESALAAVQESALTNVRHVDVRLTADCPLKGVRAMLVLGKLQQVGLVRSTHPAQAQWTHEAFDGAFRVILVTGADDERIEHVARSAGDVAQVVVRRPHLAQTASRAGSLASSLLSPRVRDLLGDRGDGIDAASDGAGAAGGGPDTRVARLDARPDGRLNAHLDARHAEAAPSMVRVDARRLDALLDLVGELVITRERLTRALEASEHPDRDVQRAAREAARLVSALQEEVLQVRLLPIAHVFDRFPRLVRDMARTLGKEVRFVMEGRELALDRSVLDALGDPVLHLLRNAIDHGLEDPATRVAAGKPVSGELIVRAARDRATVVVQVQDDGRGIDREAVRERALASGLLPPDHMGALDDDQLLAIIAHPGFSTARQVSRVSGRGVGVDVVNTRVRALGGQLELETIAGVGTVVTMRLPASLAITRALLVQVGEEVFALPAAHVEEALPYHDALRVPGARRAVTIRDEVIPLVALRERFGWPDAESAEQHLAVVELAGKRAALLVDALVSQQDIVVKPLDVVRGAAPWFSGATVLGDGSPALIVDVTSVV